MHQIGKNRSNYTNNYKDKEKNLYDLRWSVDLCSCVGE